MNTEQKNFIKTVGALASADMKKSGVLASLTIAQAITETGWGTSGLAAEGKALFGIKATKSWKGKVYCKDTKECYDGVNLVAVKSEAFRAYDSWEESVTDHSAFLKANKRYKEVIGETDYKKACTLLRLLDMRQTRNMQTNLLRLSSSISLQSLTARQRAKRTREREQPGRMPESTTGYRLGLIGEKKVLTLWRSRLRRPDIRTYS